MLHISPVKIAAGIVAVVLAVTGLFYFSEARQGVVNMFAARKKPPAAQTTRQTDATATASGVRVIPIGVAPQASSAPARRSSSGG
ncbi:hypothetical protein [Roseateles noduli]|uniref:hypothetical protein n=1 Tax=Roseateles noduli TaxID=2052484 RepID=UPI003D65AFA4